MVRSPKSSSAHHNSSSNRKTKRRRNSSSSPSDNDERYQRRQRDDPSARFKPPAGVRIKNEPVTEDESHQRRPQRASEPSGAPRRNPRSNKDEQSYQWGKKPEGETTKEEPVEVEKPNFGLSGALAQGYQYVQGRGDQVQ